MKFDSTSKLDPASNHRVTFIDTNGVSKTLAARFNGTTFEWDEAAKPFTLNSGLTEGTDYEYTDDGSTLVIKSNKVTSISGGSVTEGGVIVQGRIKLADNISGPVSLTLNGMDYSRNAVGSGLSLGVGIRTGYNGATCDSIHIKGGTIRSEGAENSTGIGAEYGETLTVPRFYLSLDALKMGNLDISTQPNAWESMPIIQNAINRVSSIRATYGALYNRLEHNQSQLQHMVENITDAESRIRDTDMAEEMMAYTKAIIMNQSAQAMLAQAAREPESVLQLLG